MSGEKTTMEELERDNDAAAKVSTRLLDAYVDQMVKDEVGPVARLLKKKDGVDSPIISAPVFDLKTLKHRMYKEEGIRQNNNAVTMSSLDFQLACAAAEIPVTRRQAKKFRQRKGLAYTVGRKRVAEQHAARQDTPEHIREANS